MPDPNQYHQDTQNKNCQSSSINTMTSPQTHSLNVLQPFASQIFSNQCKLEIPSRTISNKNSFHTDDSANLLPSGVNLAEKEGTVSRQSTHAFRTLAMRNQGGHQNASKDQETGKAEEILEDIDLYDEDLDKIKVPQVSQNQMFSLTNSCIIRLEEFIPFQDEHDSDEGSKEELTNSQNSSLLLDTSIKSYNLGSLLSNSQSPFLPNNQISQTSNAIENQYHTLAIGQSIWSPQVPPQTQQQFLQTQSQIVQQQNQIHYEIHQKLQNDIQSVQNYHLTQSINHQQLSSQNAQHQLQQQTLNNSPLQTMMSQDHVIVAQTLAPKEFFDQATIALQPSQAAQISHPFAQGQSQLPQTSPMFNPPIMLPSQCQSQAISSIQHLINQSSYQMHPSQDISQTQMTSNELGNIPQHQQIEPSSQQNTPFMGIRSDDHNHHHLRQISSNGSHHHMQQNHDPNSDHNTQLQHLYMNRQINRHMLNPVYKIKGHKLESQNSFNRNATSSPLLFIPGNLSVIRPPPGFEHTIPANLHLMKQMIAQSQVQQHPQFYQGLNYNPHLSLHPSHPFLINMMQPLNMPQNPALQQQLYQQPLQQQQIVQINQTSLQPQSQQQQHSPRQIIQQKISGTNLLFDNQTPQDYAKSKPKQSSEYPFNTGYLSFFGEQVETKKSELDEQLRKTTQQLEHKFQILENLELQQILNRQNKPSQEETDMDDLDDDIEDEGYEEDQEGEQEEIKKGQQDDQRNIEELEKRHNVHSFQSCKSSFSKHNNNNEQLREQMIAKRTELFKKLHDQLNKLKSEMFQENESSSDPKLHPFKQDPCKYLEKILSLISIINEVDSHTNMQEIKTQFNNIVPFINDAISLEAVKQYDKTKVALEKVKQQKTKFFQRLSDVTMQLHDLEYNYQTVQNENNYLKDKMTQERENLEMIINSLQDSIRDLTLTTEQQNQTILDLQAQIENERSSKKDLISEKSLENDRVNSIKSECNKKICEQQAEIENLREYIKKRSQEELIKRGEERKTLENEIASIKEQFDKMSKSHEVAMKEKDIELRVMKQHLLRIEPEFFNTNLLSGPDKVKECDDCKKKEKQIQDLDLRVKDLTEYIKQHKDIKNKEIFLPQQNQEKSLVSNNSSQTLKESSQSPKNLQYDYQSLLTVEFLNNLDKLMDIVSHNQIKPLTDYKSSLSQIRLLLSIQQNKQQVALQTQRNNKPLALEEIKEEKYEEDQTSDKQVQNLNEVINEIMTSLKKELNKILACQTYHQNFSSSSSNTTNSINFDSAETQDGNVSQEKGSSFFGKMEVDKIIKNFSIELLEEGKEARKQCHMLVIEVEKLLYKLSSILVQEQSNLEAYKNLTDEQKVTVTQKNQGVSFIEQRIQLNDNQSRIFQQILESYLQLPLKLKPIFDMMKRYEKLIGKFYHADTSLFKDLIRPVINNIESKFVAHQQVAFDQQTKENENQVLIQKKQEEIDQLKARVISLSEKLIQVESAYKALTKHLSSNHNSQTPSKPPPGLQMQQVPQQQASYPLHTQLQTQQIQQVPNVQQNSIMPTYVQQQNVPQASFAQSHQQRPILIQENQMQNQQILQSEHSMRQYIFSQTQNQQRPQVQQMNMAPQLQDQQTRSQPYGYQQPSQQIGHNKKHRRKQHQPYSSFK